MNVKGIDGLPVEDAKKPVTIHITASDISKADVKRPETCAAARACLRELHAKEVRVHLGRVYVRRNESNWQRYQTPKGLRAELIAFDRGGRFEPGEFVLLPLRPSKRPTGKGMGGARTNKKSRKLSRPQHIVKDVRTGPI